MGDMLCTTPMLRSVRKFYPDAKLILVTKESTRYTEIFSGKDKIADEVICFERGIEKLTELAQKLRAEKIDLAIIPSTVVFSVTNHVIGYLSGSKIRIGVASINNRDNNASFLLNVKSHFLWDSRKIHQIERNLDIISQAGIERIFNRIVLIPDEEQKKYSENFLIDNNLSCEKIIIGIHPGAAKVGNLWQTEKFVEIISRLYIKYGAFFLITEGPEDKEHVNRLTEGLKNKQQEIPHLCFRGTLRQVVSVIDRCSLFISNDTGIMHLASGLEVPLVALFGNTNAYEWGPVGQNRVSIQSTTDNIDDISVNKVFEACCKLLSESLQQS
jgi:heptosyltransferase-2